jgi:hypothetical protein
MDRPTVMAPVKAEDLDPEILLRFALDKLRRDQAAATRLPRDRYRALAITALEESILWLKAERVLE